MSSRVPVASAAGAARIAAGAAWIAAGLGVGLVALVAVQATSALRLSDTYLVAATLVFAGIAGVALARVGAHHPHARLGAANLITGLRAVLTALVAGAAWETPARPLAWAVVAAALAAVALDGADGFAARRQRLVSAFGARFDMEVDALLILALSVLAWTFGKAGAWVLLSGLLRYAFVAASWPWPWFDRPLPPSRRRQTVCVVQIAGLMVALLPVVPTPVSAWVAAMSLVVLSWSFGIDVRWLAQRRG